MTMYEIMYGGIDLPTPPKKTQLLPQKSCSPQNKKFEFKIN